jgi:hypothetical protein
MWGRVGLIKWVKINEFPILPIAKIDGVIIFWF